eukprot:8294817-Alexandrium_andersonii.AAC.1
MRARFCCARANFVSRREESRHARYSVRKEGVTGVVDSNPPGRRECRSGDDSSLPQRGTTAREPYRSTRGPTRELGSDASRPD